ncbi:MAG: hypothetical protein AB7I68_11525 [Porticoccaceae bacterium]
MLLKWDGIPGRSFLMLLSMAAVPCAWSQPEPEQQYELIALDVEADRAVLMKAGGNTESLGLDQESADGLRLTALSAEWAWIEVRHQAAGEIVAYRVRLGESLTIRPLPKQSAGGVRVITNAPAMPGDSR